MSPFPYNEITKSRFTEYQKENKKPVSLILNISLVMLVFTLAFDFKNSKNIWVNTYALIYMHSKYIYSLT